MSNGVNTFVKLLILGAKTSIRTTTTHSSVSDPTQEGSVLLATIVLRKHTKNSNKSVAKHTDKNSVLRKRKKLVRDSVSIERQTADHVVCRFFI